MRLDREQLAALAHELREVADEIDTVIDALPEEEPATLRDREYSLTALLGAAARLRAGLVAMTGRHALYVGWVLGCAHRHGVPLVPVTDHEGNYTDRLVLDLVDDNVTLTIVVPPPPDDWVLP